MAKTTVPRPRSAPKRTTATQMPRRFRTAKGGTERPTWTFMLYLAGDNNLDDEMVWTLKEIFRVGVPTGVQVTARLDTSARRGIRVFQPSTTLDTDGVFSLLHAREDAETDSGDPDPLVQFMVDSIDAAPADHYALILSGHGSGIIGDFLTDANTEQRRAFQPGSLSLPDLRVAFRRLRQRLQDEELQLQDEAIKERARRGESVIDILGMDSCLMSMAEVCAEISGEVSFLVGSEGFEPNAGWPYFRLLQRFPFLTNRTDFEPRQLAVRLAQRYTTYYSDFIDAGLSVDVSVCDVGTGSIDTFKAAVAAFVTVYEDAVRTATTKDVDMAIVLAHWRAQSYKDELYVDVADLFARVVEELARLRTPSTAVERDALARLVAAAKQVISAVEAPGVVVVSETCGPSFQHSHGLSVYFPWSFRNYEEQYASTAFARCTRWDSFLEAHLTRTQREMRRSKSASTQQQGPGPLVGDEILIPVDKNFGAAAGVATVAGGAGPAAASPFAAAGGKTSAPSSKTSAPSSKTSAPSSRTSAPSSKFALDMHALLRELPSRMKNHATEAVRVIRIDPIAARAIAHTPDDKGTPGLSALKTELAKRKR